MSLVVYCLTAIVVAVTLIPLLPSEKWWVRDLDFPRLQFAVLCLVSLLLNLTILDLECWIGWGTLLLAAGCLVYQLSWILPYTPLVARQVANCPADTKQADISILTANVLTSNRDAEGLLDIVQQCDPDILITLESDRWWQEALSSLEDRYPYLMQCPLDNLYGMHLYSRLELQDTQLEFLLEQDVPSIHSVVVLPDKSRIRAHFLHPAPPSPTENSESSERDAELLMVARSVAETNEPVIVTGDLNDVAWSATTRLFRKISRLLDPRIGRGMFNTFHAEYWFLRWPLDHIFHSEHFTLKKIQRMGYFGSDHFPLYTELCFTPCHEQRHGEAPEVDAEDRARAAEKMEDENVDLDQVPEPRSAR